MLETSNEKMPDTSWDEVDESEPRGGNRGKYFSITTVLFFLSSVGLGYYSLDQKGRADYSQRRWENLQTQRTKDSTESLKKDSLVKFLIVTSPLNGKGCWKVKTNPDSTQDMTFVPYSDSIKKAQQP